jgi:hypothetical protein
MARKVGADRRAWTTWLVRVYSGHDPETILNKMLGERDRAEASKIFRYERSFQSMLISASPVSRPQTSYGRDKVQCPSRAWQVLCAR